jgi:hypothetical protein
VEIELLPHIIMTLDVDWDPKQYDIAFDEIGKFCDTSLVEFAHKHFKNYGEYQQWIAATDNLVSQD